MILILTKTKTNNQIDCDVSIIAEGVHPAGKLHFPNQNTWTRFLGALQRGSIGMRDLEVRLDVAEVHLPEPEKEKSSEEST